jgi:lipid-binding SYLF domain-containing protein
LISQPKKETAMKKLWAMIAGMSLFLLVVSSQANETEKKEAEILVDQAATSVEAFANDPDLGWFKEKVKEAKALLIIPRNLKGAFIVGGSGGSGVLIAQSAESGQWGYPAFYTLGAVSLGLQIGAEASEVILMIMTDRGMESLLTSSFKLGADVTLAAGPVGGGAKAQTADILSYSRSKGAFVGASLDGAIVKTRDQKNTAYYGQSVSPTDILIRKSVSNPQASRLRVAVTKVTAE